VVRSVLFGEKDAIKEFKLRLEYRVNGSNATFSKEKTFEVLMGSSPFLLDIDYPKEVNSGQQMTLSITITSNSNVVMKNSLIKVEYPYGFTYKSSNIKPLRDDSVWNIGDLRNGDKKVLTINGVLLGQNLEDRSFQISAGTQSLDLSKDFDATLVASIITVGIRKSFFDLSVTSSNLGVVDVGQIVPININWQNTLPDRIVGGRIEARLSGNVFDESSVSVSNGGFYRSTNDTISWDKNSTAILNDILPGEDGRVAFTLSSFSNQAQVRSIKNPHIDVHVTMFGERSGTDTTTIFSEADITIKLKSILTIVARSYRSIGSIVNTGLIPPRADKETTYAIAWTLTNTTNDLKDVSVDTKLPEGVEWKGVISPQNERVSYDPDTRSVTWTVGNVSYGTGFTNSPREVFFQVGLTASITQIGSTGILITKTNIEATDTYTETQIKLVADTVTTHYSDPLYNINDDVIIK
jgi:hypothetical protein